MGRQLVGLCAVCALASSMAACNKKSGANGSGESAAVAAAAAAQTRASGPGRVAYMLSDKHAFLVEASKEATPVNVSQALNKLSKGEDETVHLARDGSWLVLTTTRFGCDGWACLVAVPGDLSSGAQVQPGGKEVHPEGPIAVSPGGTFAIYGEKGQHERDLFLTRREGGKWSSPVLLSGASKSAFNAQPAISHDGKKILFDCGNEPYGQEGTGICEVNADGSGFRQVLAVGSGWASDAKALHHPDYAPDGSIVFEADRKGDGERIWRLPVGKTEPVQLGNFGNDNSPCVLPNGKIVSLWLQRPGGEGKHEIKVMAPDGGSDFMALIGTDVLDAQISCGN